MLHELNQSSGLSDGERRMLFQMLSLTAFEVRDRSPMEVVDDGLGHFLRLLLLCFRLIGHYSVPDSPEAA